MGDRLAMLETQSTRLANVVSMIEKQIKVAILIRSLSQLTEDAAVISSIGAPRKERATCNYVTTVFVKNQEPFMNQTSPSTSMAQGAVAKAR